MVPTSKLSSANCPVLNNDGEAQYRRMLGNYCYLGHCLSLKKQMSGSFVEILIFTLLLPYMLYATLIFSVGLAQENSTSHICK